MKDYLAAAIREAGKFSDPARGIMFENLAKVLEENPEVSLFLQRQAAAKLNGRTTASNARVSA